MVQQPDYRTLAEARGKAYLIGPDAFVLVGRDRTIFDVNEPTELLTGRERTDLIGQPVAILVPEDRRERHDQFMSSFFANPGRRVMGADRDVSIVQITEQGERIIPVRIHLAAASIRGMGTIAIATIHLAQHHWSDAPLHSGR